MDLGTLLTLFQYFHAVPNKLGYIGFIILSYSLYLDWIQISNEFYNDIHTKAVTCKHLYEGNRCDMPIPAMVEQCIRWYTCAQTQNISGTLIWAEVIKRFVNSILTLELRAMVLITINVFILLSFIDREIFRQFLGILKDAIRFVVICITIVFCVRIISFAHL